MCLKRTHFNFAVINDNLANLESKFIANGGKWEEFKIGDLFEVYTGGDMIIGNLENGDIPLISHKNTDNGVAKYIAKVDNANIFDYTKTISLADRGCFCASTQNQNFYIGTRVKALVFKENDNVTKNIRLFFVCAINKLQVFFTEYSSNATDELPALKIKLPTNKDGKIAFDFMESFIKELELERIKELEAYLSATGLKDYELTDKEKQTLDIFGNANSVHFYPPQNTPPQTPRLRGGAFSASTSFAHEYSKNSPFLTNEQSSYPPSRSTSGARGWVNLQWQEFRIGDLFEKISPKFLGKGNKFKAVSKIQTNEYNIPIVYAKFGDNGIMYWAKSGDFETYKNILSVIYNGAVAAGLVYAQPYETGILAEAYFIKLKNQNVSFKVNLFLQCVLLKILYPKYSRDYLATWSNKVENERLLLPIDENGQIAFEFMESFISAVQKEVIRGVNLWSEKRIQAAKQSIL